MRTWELLMPMLLRGQGTTQLVRMERQVRVGRWAQARLGQKEQVLLGQKPQGECQLVQFLRQGQRTRSRQLRWPLRRR
jgi:hypothetical protein